MNTKPNWPPMRPPVPLNQKSKGSFRTDLLLALILVSTFVINGLLIVMLRHWPRGLAFGLALAIPFIPTEAKAQTITNDMGTIGECVVVGGVIVVGGIMTWQLCKNIDRWLGAPITNVPPQFTYLTNSDGSVVTTTNRPVRTKPYKLPNGDWRLDASHNGDTNNTISRIPGPLASNGSFTIHASLNTEDGYWGEYWRTFKGIATATNMIIVAYDENMDALGVFTSPKVGSGHYGVIDLSSVTQLPSGTEQRYAYFYAELPSCSGCQ